MVHLISLPKTTLIPSLPMSLKFTLTSSRTGIRLIGPKPEWARAGWW